MIFIRRRLLFWIVKAYARRLKKIIFLSFIVGLAIFILARLSMGFITANNPLQDKRIIGVSGAYTTDTLPLDIVSSVSYGLTTLSASGEPKPGIAERWKVEEDGKKYTFYLQKNIYFSDGTNLTSEEVSYNFSDVAVERPDKYTISFKLKDAYSPFLVTVSKPILKKGFIGVGNYRLENVATNGDFVESLELVEKKSKKRVKYQFYPTTEAVKTAYAIGEINSAGRLNDTFFKGMDIGKFKKTKASRNVNYDKLVTIFYNTQDSILSDKKIRNALTYAIPSEFSAGERNSTPFAPVSWVAPVSINPYEVQDLENAKILMDAAELDSKKKNLTLKTLPQYEETAEVISAEWKKLGITTSIEVVDSVPVSFQVFLGDFIVSRDPDQYPLWHSGQQNNISRYKTNLRIDKLLEDGRKEQNITERKRIYSDFQKYLLDDSPAAFLYFPYHYNLERR